MSSNFISHVFSSLLFMEKYLEHSKKIIDPYSAQAGVLAEQQDILKQMRLIANKLQLEHAREDWLAIVRSLRVFYGLNYMVRPEIISTFVALANKQPRQPFSMTGAVYH